MSFDNNRPRKPGSVPPQRRNEPSDAPGNARTRAEKPRRAGYVPPSRGRLSDFGAPRPARPAGGIPPSVRIENEPGATGTSRPSRDTDDARGMNRPPRGFADARVMNRPPRDTVGATGMNRPLSDIADAHGMNRPPRDIADAAGEFDFSENLPLIPRAEEAPDGPAAREDNILAGRNPIREALRADAPMEKLLVAKGDISGAARDIVGIAREKGVVVQFVPRDRLDALCPGNQGMLAYVAAAEYSTIDDMLSVARERGQDPFIVVLDGITDPHNLGAIIRSAECAGAHGVIIPERRASGLTPVVAKAAAGALSYVKIARVPNLNRAVDELKKAGVWVLAAALEGEDAFECDLSGAVALVVGSEGDGISRLTLEKCDRRITLPMAGKIGSLNASVAAGILLYEIARARRAK